MNSVRAPRWQRLSVVPEHRAEAVPPPPPPTPPPPTALPVPTPIYTALVREWGAAGRTVPASGGAGRGGV
ncbi:hypothetical protein OG875_18280 [Streptomyces sp. NBC_01498]|uniref:hypothetical protein n=1 Tax=Streptomyces sp. NBC_01498 TaxID=2975870 RepID=UPI002E7B9F71|nr:hypothetical protein [Streptomyces sp. NBC_01498]WTL26360.1 hypothetical protein OG875_18280 [Streptomyces sp. NBC_01498]